MRKLVERRANLGDKAPITEAVIDIRTRASEDLDLDDLRNFAAPWRERFPTPKLQTQFETHFKIEPGHDAPSLETRHAVRGFLFSSSDQQCVVQARRDGFSFSKLKPYESWDSLRREAHELWEHYREVARPSAVVRLGVRYINRIWLPPVQVELGDWFTLHPEAPDHLVPMEEFQVRIVTRHPDRPDMRALVTIATAPPDEQRGPSVVLDIDVFLATDLLPSAPEIWPTLDDLRDYKNDVFFGIITHRTEESFRT